MSSHEAAGDARRASESEALRRFYNFNAPFYDLTRWLILRGRQEAVGALKLSAGDTVFDVGCGTGLNLPYLFDAVGPGGRVTAVDFSSAMLSRARRRCEANGWENVTLVEADASTLAREERVNGVLFSFSLAMIPNWEAALARAADHLRPGGRLVVWDFGPFTSWPQPARGIARWWLEVNHVHLDRRFAAAMPTSMTVEADERVPGGAYVKVVGRKRDIGGTGRRAP